jgi:predicted PurR-regulated permease PerM
MATHADGAGRSSAMPLAVLVVTTAVLYLAREVIIPFALAVLFAFLLAPLAHRLEILRLGRGVSAIVSVLVAIAIVAAVGTVAVDQMVSLAGKLPEYKDNIARKMRDLRAGPTGTLGKAAEALKEIEEEVAGDKPAAGEKPAARKPAAPERSPEKPSQFSLPTSPLEIVATLGVPLVYLLLGALAVIVITTLMLVQRQDLRDRVVRLVGQGRMHVTTQAIEDAGGRVSRYLLSLLVVNVCYGVPLGIAFWWLGIPNALLWGMLSTLLRFVPYIGVPIASLMPLALAFAISDGWALVAWAAAVILAIDMFIAHVVEPWLYGARTGLSPIAIVFGAIFWTWLWGPIGLVLATPITVSIAVVARYIPRFEFLSVILSAEPVLPPHVRFYQRLVAFEDDEASDLAEEFAREHGVASLYEAVLLPTLVLAKRDRQRLQLDDRRERFVLDNINRIVEEVGEGASPETPSQGKEPRPGGDRAAMCIIPARDDFDQLAGSLLARRLAPEHFSALMLPQDLLAAEVLDRVAETCDKAVCISAVPPSAAANASYLCKRLRKRFPAMKIVVALWMADTNLEHLTQRLRDAGADEVVTRLPDAVERARLVTPPAVRAAA